jgi:hypothetical protein
MVVMGFCKLILSLQTCSRLWATPLVSHRKDPQFIKILHAHHDIHICFGPTLKAPPNFCFQNTMVKGNMPPIGSNDSRISIELRNETWNAHSLQEKGSQQHLMYEMRYYPPGPPVARRIQK